MDELELLKQEVVYMERRLKHAELDLGEKLLDRKMANLGVERYTIILEERKEEYEKAKALLSEYQRTH